MRDLVLEAFFKKIGTDYEYVKQVPLAEIKTGGEAVAQIRTHPTNQQTVEKYAMAAANGAMFPALVMYRAGKDAFGIINGLHRHEAFQQVKRKVTDGYVVATKDHQEIEILRRLINTVTTGEPQTESERVEHAVRLTKMGYKPANAAAAMLIKPNRVYNRIHIERAVHILSRFKTEIPPKVSSEAVLHMLDAGREHHFVKMVKMAAGHGFTSDQCLKMAREVRRSNTDREADTKLAEWDSMTRGQQARTLGGQMNDPRRPYSLLMRILEKTWMDIRQIHSFKSVTSEDAIRGLKVVNSMQERLTQLKELFEKAV
jgi:hypothetical protein